MALTLRQQRAEVRAFVVIQKLAQKYEQESLRAHARGDWNAAALHATRAEQLREKLRG